MYYTYLVLTRVTATVWSRSNAFFGGHIATSVQAAMGHEVVTSLVCGTLSPFAIFIHPRIVITRYARCRMPACMLHEPRVIKPPTDDDFFFEIQSPRLPSAFNRENMSNFSIKRRCSSPENGFKSLKTIMFGWIFGFHRVSRVTRISRILSSLHMYQGGFSCTCGKFEDVGNVCYTKF